MEKLEAQLKSTSGKINNKEKSILYLIAFSLTINQYLHSDFENFLIEILFFLSFNLLILYKSFLLNLYMTSISTFLPFGDLLIKQLFDL